MIWVCIGIGEVVDLSDVECAYILGSILLSVGVVLVVVVGTFDGVSTLRDGVSGFGSFSALLIFLQYFLEHCGLGLLPPNLVLFLKMVL